MTALPTNKTNTAIFGQFVLIFMGLIHFHQERVSFFNLG